MYSEALSPAMFWLSAAGLAVVALALLHLFQQPARQLLLQGSRMLHGQFRLAARSLQRLAGELAQREQRGVQTLQREIVHRQLDREIQRLHHIISQDLTGFQPLQRQLDERLTTLFADYEKAAQMPPTPPEWTAAVEAIARLPEESGSEGSRRILEELHATVQTQQREAMREYRWSVTARHKILAGMRPVWGQLKLLLERVNGRVSGLEQRMARIDRLAERFDHLLANGRLARSAIAGRFLLSALGVAMAAALALFSHELLTPPLATLLAPTALGPLTMSAGAAALLTLSAAGVGVLLFESLQVTRMFPLVHGLTRRTRGLLVLLALGLLATLATLSSLLALWWHDGSPALPAQVLAMLGLVLPLLLALAVLPLEIFSYTLLPVLGALGQALLGLTAIALRITGALCLHLGQLLVHCYDLLLVPSRSLVRLWQQRHATAAGTPGPADPPPETAAKPSQRLRSVTTAGRSAEAARSRPAPPADSTGGRPEQDELGSGQPS